MTPDGAVRAMVGGRNYAESQYNRAVAAKRQPGSAFKPFVYLTALERGLTPETDPRGQADRRQGLEAGELQPRIFRPGDADAGAGDVAQHGVGAAHARSRADGGGARPRYRLGIASKLDANASIALGTSEVSLHRTGLRLCAVRQWRRRRRPARGRARPHRTTARCCTRARRRSSAASSIRAMSP